PPAFVLSQDQTLQKNKQKTITGKKQRNQQNNNNKQQTPTTTIDAHVRVRVHVHVQTKFASSNDTLSSSQTTLAYSRLQLLKAVSAKQPWSV
ncbi:hypothetical protein, partial [Corynebacterium matruchotii]|uniref:hypothetical protein n=1 Tax=Corynebacterium matruchotii TaxID=43768 RepID=UPI0028E20826